MSVVAISLTSCVKKKRQMFAQILGPRFKGSCISLCQPVIKESAWMITEHMQTCVHSSAHTVHTRNVAIPCWDYIKGIFVQ